MDQPKSTAYYKGYTQGYLNGYHDGAKDAQNGTSKDYIENDITQLPIEVMEITTRAYHCLTRMGCKHILDLLKLNESTLQHARGMGTKTASEIACWLDSHGFSHTAWSRYSQY